MVQIDWVPMPQPRGDLGLSRKGLGTCFRGAKNTFFLKCSWFKQLDSCDDESVLIRCILL